MSKQRCKLSLLEAFLDLDLRCRLVGGVLLVFALAFIPNSVFATELDSNTDYDYIYSHTNGSLNWGCNTVVSDGGYRVLANRGSLVSHAPSFSDGGFPCGYMYYNGAYDDHSVENYNRSFGGTSNSWLSDFTYSWSYPTRISDSLQQSSYLGANYLTRLYNISVKTHNAYHELNFINGTGVSGDTQYNNLIFVGLNVESGAFQPSVLDLDFEYMFKNNSAISDADKESILDDIFEHSITGFGSPKAYLEDTLYSTIASDYGITNEADWENNNFYYYIAYLPTYDFSWSFDGDVLAYCGSRCASVYPSNLAFDPVFGIADGDISVNYVALSNMYNNTDDKASTFNNMSSLHISCLTSVCKTAMNNKAITVAELHNQNWTGWIDSAQNPGQSWFSVFNFNVLFPFQSFFTSFTNDRCVDIPIIASWIHSPQNQYCTWWSNDIRATLTPVFSTFGLMILFGFIVHWLAGRSSNAFRDNDTTKIGDRF